MCHALCVQIVLPVRFVAVTSQRASLQTSLLEEQEEFSSKMDSSLPVVASPDARPAKGNVLTRWLHSHFPDQPSRWAAVLAFLLALGVSIYWLQWTITSRWQYSRDHPVQSISFESVQRFPQLLGNQLYFVERFIPSNQTYAKLVTIYGESVCLRMQRGSSAHER